MFTLRKSDRKSSARKQIDIQGIKDGILQLSHTRYRLVLALSSINFELKSEEERDAIIDMYESFLNSIGIPLQILIRTREIDMDNYLAELKMAGEREEKGIYRDQLENYAEFIQTLVETNKILSRFFYLVVPYDSDQKLEFEMVQEQITQRAEIIRKGLARIGISSRILTSLEILDQFYSFYSPVQAKLQPLSLQALELLHTEYIQKGIGNE